MNRQKMGDKIVYLVHCVDTEGPLYESLPATFGRVKRVFGLDLKPSKENLHNLRRGEGVPGKIRSTVMEFVSEDRLNYNVNWKMIDDMLAELLSKKWRNMHADDFGTGYIFNWFIVDHVGHKDNPRRKALGYNTVFNHYKKKLVESRSVLDEMHWHFHPVAFSREALKSSNNFSWGNEHLQSLAHRVIDHGWFPSVFRPGMHCERPDINLFLEQWIPFDYGNQGIESDQDDKVNLQKDVGGGRFGDWRRATSEWEVYHPDFYDYQRKGNMKRYIARCLNLNARLRVIDEHEIEKAFERSSAGKKTIMAVANHDEREMRPYIDQFYAMVRKVQKRYPEVKIKNSGALQAMREGLGLVKEKPVRFDVSLKRDLMTIVTDKPCWGPQPFFCFKTKDGQYVFENLDYHGDTHWSYTFDEESVCLDELEAIGLATNDGYGNVTVWRKLL